MGDAAALGLGDIRVRSALGERFSAEIEILTNGKETLDTECFRLRHPGEEGELPWLKRATLSLRRATPPVLEIRSSRSVHDPILQVGVTLACGQDLRRDFTVLLSPPGRDAEPPQPTPVAVAAPEALPAERRPAPRRAMAERLEPFGKFTPGRSEKRGRRPALSDRLVLSSGGSGEPGGELSLRLATELLAWKENELAVREAQRDVLRLEFRMLMAMNEQATSQLAAAEKLRNMESTLGDLQQRAADFANRMERGAGTVKSGTEVAVEARPAASEALPVPARPVPEAAGEWSEWGFYAALLSAMLGAGAWVGWRQYRQARQAEMGEIVPEPIADPLHGEEIQAMADVDLPVEPASGGSATEVDLPLGVDEGARTPVPSTLPGNLDSQFSISGGATVDEHFEANPVMELAEIMLSFGRVKGAAQALQEYIDHNPQEALQPWIRLMDVYRMAGMRKEFEQLAQDLNRHFNVEVQHWDPDGTADSAVPPLNFATQTDGQPVPMGPKAMTVEDIGHIRNKLIESWGTQDCLDYLHQLLRDNRGGKRSGFTLQVVEEILFLIDLLEARKQF